MVYGVKIFKIIKVFHVYAGYCKRVGIIVDFAYSDLVWPLYVETERENLPIAKSNEAALAIFDMFAAHRSEKVLDKL